jgi:hypothetical protein
VYEDSIEIASSACREVAKRASELQSEKSRLESLLKNEAAKEESPKLGPASEKHAEALDGGAADLVGR